METVNTPLSFIGAKMLAISDIDIHQYLCKLSVRIDNKRDLRCAEGKASNKG
jgi:hypothetical protein